MAERGERYRQERLFGNVTYGKASLCCLLGGAIGLLGLLAFEYFGLGGPIAWLLLAMLIVGILGAFFFLACLMMDYYRWTVRGSDSVHGMMFGLSDDPDRPRKGRR